MWKNSNGILVSFKVGIGNVIIMYKTEKNLLWGLNIFNQKKKKIKRKIQNHHTLSLDKTQEVGKRGVDTKKLQS